jgi:hypothetical protein
MRKTVNFLGIFSILSLLGAGAVALADEPAAREERRVEILERYDADGDGRLSREERRTARADGARLGPPGGGRGGHGGFGRAGGSGRGGGVGEAGDDQR